MFQRPHQEPGIYKHKSFTANLKTMENLQNVLKMKALYPGYNNLQNPDRVVTKYSITWIKGKYTRIHVLYFYKDVYNCLSILSLNGGYFWEAARPLEQDRVVDY